MKFKNECNYFECYRMERTLEKIKPNLATHVLMKMNFSRSEKEMSLTFYESIYIKQIQE